VSEPNLVMAGFRLPASLIKRIDRHAKRISAETGLNVTRADAVRALLHSALMQEEHSRNGKKR
jgi:hypothetical protein